jgi:hypothetical protein
MADLPEDIPPAESRSTDADALYERAVEHAKNAAVHEGNHLSEMSQLAQCIAEIFERQRDPAGQFAENGFISWCMINMGLPQASAQTKYGVFTPLVKHLIQPQTKEDHKRVTRLSGALTKWMDTNAAGPQWFIPADTVAAWFTKHGGYIGIYEDYEPPRSASDGGASQPPSPAGVDQKGQRTSAPPPPPKLSERERAAQNAAGRLAAEKLILNANTKGASRPQSAKYQHKPHASAGPTRTQATGTGDKSTDSHSTAAPSAPPGKAAPVHTPTETMNEELRAFIAAQSKMHLEKERASEAAAASLRSEIATQRGRIAELEKQLAAVPNLQAPILTQPLPAKLGLSDEKKLKGRELVERAFHAGNSEAEVLNTVRAYHRTIGDWSPSDLGIGSYDAAFDKQEENLREAVTRTSVWIEKYDKAQQEIRELKATNKQLRDENAELLKGKRIYAPT